MERHEIQVKRETLSHGNRTQNDRRILNHYFWCLACAQAPMCMHIPDIHYHTLLKILSIGSCQTLDYCLGELNECMWRLFRFWFFSVTCTGLYPVWNELCIWGNQLFQVTQYIGVLITIGQEKSTTNFLSSLTDWRE